MELNERIEILSRLRRDWAPPEEPETLADRRAHAAWANAGIEGNPIPWGEARRLIACAAEDDSHAVREIFGCLRALEFMETIEPPLRLAHVRTLHDLIVCGLGAAAGTLRGREVAIVKQSGPDAGRPVFTPPHPARIPELMDSLLAGLAAEADPDPALSSGRFHYEFQSIHPFEDGNGRVGRLLSTWIARRGWRGAGFHLSPAIARAGSVYYLALRAVRPDYESEVADGLRPWLLPYLDMFEDALTHPDSPKQED